MEFVTFREYLAQSPHPLEAVSTFGEKKLVYDSRYRSLVGELDQMIKALVQEPERNLSVGLRELLCSMREQMNEENEFMALVEFPMAAQHRFHHLYICACTNDLCQRAYKKRPVLSNEITYIRQLLLEHIHVQDRSFEEYLTPRQKVGASIDQ